MPGPQDFSDLFDSPEKRHAERAKAPVAKDESGKVSALDYGRLLAASALRVGTPIAGGIGGAALGTLAAPGPGTAIGASAGGAAGGALGEYLAEKVEPEIMNPTHETSGARIGINAAIGAIPGGAIVRGGKPLLSAALGGTMSYASTVADKTLAQNEDLTHAANPLTWKGAELMGTAMGAGMGYGFGKFMPEPPFKTGNPLAQATYDATQHPTDTTPRLNPTRRGGLRVQGKVEEVGTGSQGQPISEVTAHPETPAVTEAEQKARAGSVPKFNTVVKDVDAGIKQAADVGKARRVVNTKSEVAFTKQQKATQNSAAADVQIQASAEADRAANAKTAAKEQTAADKWAIDQQRAVDEIEQEQQRLAANRQKEADEAAAQARLDAAKKGKIAQEGPVTERTSLKTGNNTAESLTTRFVDPPKKPGEGDKGASGPAGTQGPLGGGPPSTIRLGPERTIFKSEREAILNRQGAGAIGEVRNPDGPGWVHVFRPGKPEPVVPVAPPVGKSILPGDDFADINAAAENIPAPADQFKMTPAEEQKALSTPVHVDTPEELAAWNLPNEKEPPTTPPAAPLPVKPKGPKGPKGGPATVKPGAETMSPEELAARKAEEAAAMPAGSNPEDTLKVFFGEGPGKANDIPNGSPAPSNLTKSSPMDDINDVDLATGVTKNVTTKPPKAPTAPTFRTYIQAAGAAKQAGLPTDAVEPVEGGFRVAHPDVKPTTETVTTNAGDAFSEPQGAIGTFNEAPGRTGEGKWSYGETKPQQPIDIKQQLKDSLAKGKPEVPPVPETPAAPRKYLGDAGRFFTHADEQAGYSKTRAALAGYSDEQLMREHRESVKASFDRVFGGQAKKFLKLVEEEVQSRNPKSGGPTEPETPPPAPLPKKKGPKGGGGGGQGGAMPPTANDQATLTPEAPVRPNGGKKAATQTLTDEQLAQLSDKDRFAYFKKQAPVNDATFMQRHGIIDSVPEPFKAEWQQLAAESPTKTSSEVYKRLTSLKSRYGAYRGEAEHAAGEPQLGTQEWHDQQDAAAEPGHFAGMVERGQAQMGRQIGAAIKNGKLGPIADRLMKGEGGFIEPEMAFKLLTTAGGAALGAATTPDDPLKGALIGGAAGFGVGMGGPALMRALMPDSASIGGGMEKVRQGLNLLPDWQRFALLSHPVNLPLNAVVGPWGSGFMNSLEHAMSGDQRGWVAMKMFLDPRNFAREMRASWQSGEARGRIEQSESRAETPISDAPEWFRHATETPATAMTEGDQAVRKLIMDAGFSEDEARRATLTNEPYMPFGRMIVGAKKGAKTEGGKRSWIANMMLPFYRTATNQLEQGLERTPVFGLIAQKFFKDVPDDARLMGAQQLLGFGSMTASFVAGLVAPSDPATQKFMLKFINNIGGQYGVPMSAAFVAGQAASQGKDSAQALVQEYAGDMPLPTTRPIADMVGLVKDGKVPTSMIVPAFLRPSTWNPVAPVANTLDDKFDDLFNQR